MCNPANIELSHSEICERLVKQAQNFADKVEREYRLPNKKIADLYFQYSRMSVIVEVKTIIKESYIIETYEKYHEHCHFLYVAAPPQKVFDVRKGFFSILPARPQDKIGIWFVDWLGVTWYRDAMRLI